MLPKRHLDLDLLRALVAIADTASFSQAASALGRSQSTISLQIKRLEELVGRPLLQRIQGRVTGPTEDGRVMIDYARQMLRLNDEAYSCFAEPTLSGTLRVGLPEELMESTFPATLKRFRETYPRMQLVVHSAITARLLVELEAGELDVALLKGVESNDTSTHSVLWREPLVWVAADGHQRSLPTPLPLALFGEGCAFRIAATATLARAGLAWQIAFCGASYTGLRHAVGAGLGIAALPQSLATPGLAIVEHGLPPLPESHIAVRYAAGEPASAAIRLVDILKEQIRQDRRASGRPPKRAAR